MKRLLNFTSNALILSGSMMLSMSTEATPILSFNNAGANIEQTYNVGDTISLDLWISGLAGNDAGGGADLGGFDFDLNFNGGITEYKNATASTSLDDNFFDLWAATPNGSNKVDFFGVSLSFDLTGQTDAFKLFTLEFTANQAGTSVLDFGSILLSDSFAFALDTNSFNTSLIVQDVPSVTVSEPNTLGLFMLGLIGSTLISRKTRLYPS